MTADVAAPIQAVPPPQASWPALIATLSVGACISRGERLLCVNAALMQLCGASADVLLQWPGAMALVADDDRPTARIHLRRARAWVPLPPFEVQCLRADGSAFDARVQHLSWSDAPGGLALWLIQDISASRASQRAMQAHLASLEHQWPALQRAQQILDQLPVPMMVVDEHGTLHQGNVALSEALGVPRHELLQRTVFDIAPHRDPAHWPEQLHSLIGQPVRHLPSDWTTASGQTLSMQIQARHIVYEDQDMALITAIAQPAAAGDERAAASSTFCATTGLPSGQLFRERLRTHSLVALIENRHLVVMVFAVHDLQLILDCGGYHRVDELLSLMAQRLTGVAQGADLLAHLGHGEFALLRQYPDAVTDDDVQQLGRTIQNALMQPLPETFPDVHLSCNLGAVVYPRDTNDVEHLFRQAQSALRLSFTLGPNAIYGHTPEATARITRRRQIEHALRNARERQELRVAYQPQVDLKNGRIHAVEALIRWTHPELGEVPPDDFLPVAEESGAIYALGAWVLREACEAASAWASAGCPPVRVAVNVSARQLQLADFASSIESLLMQIGMPPHQLIIELTESLLHVTPAVVRQNLEHLKSIGVGIALDDFGTGHASLQSLRRLPIDIIKIDRTLVPDVTTDARDVSITRAIINMAHNLQKQVVAVGVETQGELAMLCANQCDLMQGFLFSTPLSADDVATWLHDDRRLPEKALGRRTRRRTLLIVDDDRNIVSALQRLLRRDGYHIITADNGQDGLQQLAKYEVDVILSDQRMPGMTGVEFLRRAKALYPQTVRLVLSGFTELRSVTDAINEGAIYKFLTKPWEDEQLRSHIAEAFSQKEMSDDNLRLDREVQDANRELADVNTRLQHLLQSQRERMFREESNLSLARAMLDGIPVPVIGIDAAGVVAFVNADAHALPVGLIPPLGGRVDAHDHAVLHQAWQGQADGHTLQDDSQTYALATRRMPSDDPHPSTLIVLTPLPTASRASAAPGDQEDLAP